MLKLQGKGVSAGIAMGTLSFIDVGNCMPAKKSVSNTAAEEKRFDEACIIAAEQLNKLADEMMEKIGKDHAELFTVHAMMVTDTDFCDPIHEMIKNEKVNAEYAVAVCGAQLSADFAAMNDDYMSARAIDIQDVAKRVIAILTGTRVDPTGGSEPLILAARDFTPSETAQFDRSKVLALVAQEGAANSHSAIFARTMGIPAIIGLGTTLSNTIDGKQAALDGTTGELYIEPSSQILHMLSEKARFLAAEKQELEKYRGLKTITSSGKHIKLFANIGSVKDVDAVLASDAEGIGLFRSEFLYLGRNDYPDENIQFENYKVVAERMGGKQVIIRTLDIGADKQVEYFNLPHEENPALGMRAIRICLTHKDLFKTQLRALYRASAFGNVAIMFPMISSLRELLEAKAVAAEVREELRLQAIAFNPDTPIGIMVETPAAAVISDILAKESDFFSLGTNDLTQYTLAVDRQNESISSFVDTHHEAVLRLIKLTVENAHNAGIWAGICGSLGADASLTKTFIEMGLDELSVEPSFILKLRGNIAAC